jgi:prepilin-type N-terminal cleavage/methylation domain-containing protein
MAVMASRPTPAPRPCWPVRGFTLLELAVVLVALGALGMLVMASFSGVDATRARQRALAEAEAARMALRTFALATRRLPCPDSSGDGREGDAAGNCPDGRQLGWLPYETLGLAPMRLGYGVFRDAANGADLVAPVSPAPAPRLDDGTPALRSALAAAAAAAVSSNHPYTTGDRALLGAENCAGNVIANPALVIVAPATDRDGDGDPFDGVNTGLPNAGLCIAAPSRGFDATYDDVVVTESAQALLGWLAAGSR